MAEEQDDSQKTEEPTEKRLSEAKEKGEQPRSQEVKHWFMLMGALLVLITSGVSVTSRLAVNLEGIFAHAGDIKTDGGSLMRLMQDLLGQIALIMAIPFLILMIAAIAGNVTQTMPVLTLEKLKPDFKKISPMAGAKRLFSAQNLSDFLKTIAKFVLVGAIAVSVLYPEWSRLELLMTLDLRDSLLIVYDITRRMLIAIVSIMALIAVTDYTFQYFQFRSKMKMSKQEVKEEYKQSEGDPHIKARLRQIRMDRSRRRMMAAVPTADVVITNPTHYAVALKYDRETMAAPLVVAKGLDLIALRIREVAEEHKIPLFENPPLARVLYATVELEHEVPPEHYRAVAEVIGFVMRLKKGMKR